MPIYDPPGPVSEAYASYYVRHLVQRAIDRAFTLTDRVGKNDGGDEPGRAAER